MPHSAQTPQILLAAVNGDRSAADQLLPLVYDELHGLAEHFMAQERVDHTLQATALVNEAYMRLIDQTQVDWQGRVHFCAVASQMIRRILVDHARKRSAAKRGGGASRVDLTDILDLSEEIGVDLLGLDEALQELRGLHERQARVVELRFFGGLTVQETAAILEISPRTVKGDWRLARAWLRERLMPR